ncbi:MAG: serine hydrolase [Phormidesmis sp.]
MTDVNGTHRNSGGQGANGQSTNGQSADKARSRIHPSAEQSTRRSRRDLTSARRRRRSVSVEEKSKGQLSSRREGSRSTRAGGRKITPLVQIHGVPSHRSVPSKTVSPDASGSSRPLLPKSQYPGRMLPSREIARKRSSRRSRKLPIPLLYLGRLAIIGLGIAAIGGTLLRDAIPNGSTGNTVITEAPATPPKKVAAFPVTLNQEIAPLKAELQELPNLYPNLLPKAFYVDVDTGNYVDLEGGGAIAAASTIKLPILLAFFEEVDAGRIDPNQFVVMQPEQIAEGSGEMQVSPPGSQFTALEVATNMIVNSDNTATNMVIDLLGGRAVMNTRFETYGLEKTKLNAPLPDLDGMNTTSPRDLVHTLLLISQGDTLTIRSRDRVLNILNRTRNKSLIAAGLEEKGALTYNKTGDIELALGDAALVDLPNGKRYAVSVLVERPTNDGRAAELIHRISGRVYQEANKAVPRPAPAVPAPTDPESPAPAVSEDVPDSGENP